MAQPTQNGNLPGRNGAGPFCNTPHLSIGRPCPLRQCAHPYGATLSGPGPAILKGECWPAPGWSLVGGPRCSGPDLVSVRLVLGTSRPLEMPRIDRTTMSHWSPNELVMGSM